MVDHCVEKLLLPLTGEDLRRKMNDRVSHNRSEVDRLSSRLNDWHERTGSSATKGLNAAFYRAVANVELSLASVTNHHEALNLLIAAEFTRDYAFGQSRLDGSRDGPVFLLENAFSLSDCLASGRFRNAEILHNQAIQLLDQRAYSEQDFYAEDLERQKDPDNFVEIIPQRLFVFVHELMGQRAGQDKQPWARWDIIGDQEYIEAARAVYTEDLDLAAATLCKLCNLHVQYSNPFPEGDNDDHLVGIEFDTPIRSLWPTEIFAWLRLRQERGLPLPNVEHPLLEQPLGHFEPTIIRNWRPEPWFVEFVDKLSRLNPRYNDLSDLVLDAN